MEYRKGDRIVVDWGRDGIYIGTVATVRSNKVYVDFDDGDKARYPEDSPKLLGKGIKKKRESAIPKSQLHKWLEEPRTKKVEKPKQTKKPKEPEPVETVPNKPKRQVIKDYTYDESGIAVPTSMDKIRSTFISSKEYLNVVRNINERPAPKIDDYYSISIPEHLKAEWQKGISNARSMAISLKIPSGKDALDRFRDMVSEAKNNYLKAVDKKAYGMDIHYYAMYAYFNLILDELLELARNKKRSVKRLHPIMPNEEIYKEYSVKEAVTEEEFNAALDYVADKLKPKFYETYKNVSLDKSELKDVYGGVRWARKALLSNVSKTNVPDYFAEIKKLESIAERKFFSLNTVFWGAVRMYLELVLLYLEKKKKLFELMPPTEKRTEETTPNKDPNRIYREDEPDGIPF